MVDKAHLAYFLNQLKDELDFKDSIDFRNRIEKSFDFRFKVQKFVFLAKYFGWDNSYGYKLYPRGPYSSALADDYYCEDILNKSSEIECFNQKAFKEFVESKSEYDLEASSTILFYKSFRDSFSLEDAIKTLSEIKPHIDSAIVKRAYLDVCGYSSSQDFILQEKSDEALKSNKNELSHRILNSIASFAQFNTNSNARFILRSLNYLKEVLRKETLDKNIKCDLLELIIRYVSEIDRLYLLINNNDAVLENINLNDVEVLFNRLESYVACELNIDIKLGSEFELYYEYDEIKNFILDEFIPKHDCLVSCDLMFSDEVGNPAFEYYIYHENDLPFEKIQDLTHEVFKEVHDFCVYSNFEDVFKTISIFIVKGSVFNVL